MSTNDKLKAAVVIPAAGSGTRMKSTIPKQFLEISRVPILVRTVLRFLAVENILTVVVAVPAGHEDEVNSLLSSHLAPEQTARVKLVRGGRTRQESVRAGLNVLPAETDLVLVHDGARPFVSMDIIENCLSTAAEKGAAIAAIPVSDTVKEVNSSGLISRTLDRKGLWQAQTPQAARENLLRKAFDLAAHDGFQGTDEASLLEHAGIPVFVVHGSERNIKITRPDDLGLAEALTRNQEMTMRIGHGFDAHRLSAGRKLILGGVAVPFTLGLLGHSDADVLTHALIDALLGAAGEGDIGRHFPDSDSRYKDISSLQLLEKVVVLLAAKKLIIGNADITVICQQPKLSPYIEQMRDNIAMVCAADPGNINIKATTTENMGYAGRGEGIAAQAVVLLQPAALNMREQEVQDNAH